MAGTAGATVRFLSRFARPGQDVAHERELRFDVDGTPRGATAYLPNDHDGHRPVPGWVPLQGITVPGRHHAMSRVRALDIPTILLHARNDTLVPCGETLRLAAAMPPSTRRDVTVTPLLGHAKMEGAATPWHDPPALAADTRRFVRAIHRLLSMLEDHSR